MPIETAPTDGAYVLVSNGRGVWVAKYKAVYQSGWKPDCPWQSMMLNHDHIPMAKQRGRPTHWMPLPEAPNARLMTAAPELLSALVEAVDTIETISPMEDDTLRRARAAIAKATGN